MSVNPNMAVREVCNLIFCDYKSKKPFLNVDFANTTTTELTGESMYAYGGHGHPKRIVFYGERGGTIAFETQIQPFKLYSLMSGAEIESSAQFIKREVLTAASGVLTLTSAPVSGSVNVFAADDDCGTALEVTTSEKTVTITDASSSNAEYIVYYVESISTGVKKLNIKATTFPKYFTAYAETLNKTEDNELVPYKMVAYKCAPQSTMSLSFSSSGEPASLTVTCDLLTDDGGNLLDMILLEEDQSAAE